MVCLDQSNWVSFKNEKPGRAQKANTHTHSLMSVSATAALWFTEERELGLRRSCGDDSPLTSVIGVSSTVLTSQKNSWSGIWFSNLVGKRKAFFSAALGRPSVIRLYTLWDMQPLMVLFFWFGFPWLAQRGRPPSKMLRLHHKKGHWTSWLAVKRVAGGERFPAAGARALNPLWADWKWREENIQQLYHFRQSDTH